MTKRTLLFLALFLSVSRAALPCSCAGDSTVTSETINYYAAVFEAQVLQVRLVERPLFSDKPDGRRLQNLHVSLRVLRSWKGVDDPVVEVTTAVEGATCGYRFEVADIYLVFAAGESPDSLGVSICSSTRRANPKDPALDVLGPPKREFKSGVADEAFYRSLATAS